ncbi:metalloregulator ArsR/SmtB family transcription factor [Clostridium gasigenes]|uniref:ArsR/SmtB family transcription factor n=1 Tax=Clostridium gasigenes TaxID=94869 RepID=UPI001C0BCB34|nr:metalloregulator ArsR/SmtB family transcription factor [Clostridium gasigenes]MBU3137109.1 metalloregulator ArsR/SmtB family transcription factor [Clostridium gasigenes]
MDNNYKQYEEVAELLKVLAHPIRLCIVRGLLDVGACNVSKMQSCLGVPQSTISQHLQKLKSVGIITGERNGLEVFYKISDDRVEAIIKALL